MDFTATQEAPTTIQSRVPSVPRAQLQGTPQQEAFWAELLDGKSNILLEARAGTGKSTSAREGMSRILLRKPNSVIRYCCYNKAIADEFAVKAPSGAHVGTMHSFGCQALVKALGCSVEKNKTYLILDAIGGDRLPRYLRKAINTLVSLAKNHGVEPDDPLLEDHLRMFIVTFDIETWKREEDVIDWAAKALVASAETTSIIDFDDMLWFPTLHDVRFPSVDHLFIDECQDLSPVQHSLAEAFCQRGQTSIVGDPYQAIYGFRGADADSIPTLRERLNANRMPLTISFRCPLKHVRLAQELVPDFEAAENAPEGTLEYGDLQRVSEAMPGDLVICRANAPLVRECLHQISLQTPAMMRGRAIGDQLTAVVKKLGDPRTCAAFVRELSLWAAREITRLDAKDGTEDLIEQVNDKAASLEAIAASVSSPTEIPARIDRLFSDTNSANRVTFSSIHRAKGSEAKHVFYIDTPYNDKRDKERPPQQWQKDQRRNLRYVALTRSMDTLTIVS